VIAGLRVLLGAIACAVPLAFSVPGAQAQGRGGQPAPPTPRSMAPIDLTGNWVAVISEDWRWRMVTPPKGDFPSIPLNMDGQRVTEAWDPARDEAAGEQCKAYGAPGLMRGPTRLRIGWLDDSTLRLETDYGMQTRVFRFGNSTQTPAARSWQGTSRAEWNVRPAGRGAGGQRFGSMKSVTTNLRPGYLRKNGVPYSANAVYTEHWDVHTRANGARYLVITSIVEDPAYLQIPWVTALHFTREPDGSKWDPTPCDARF
jgi:hypothetical protein